MRSASVVMFRNLSDSMFRVLDGNGLDSYTLCMDTLKIIEAIGGRKAVIEMTGLSRGRISQWVTEKSIPTPWLKFFEAKFPNLDWKQLSASVSSSREEVSA